MKNNDNSEANDELLKGEGEDKIMEIKEDKNKQESVIEIVNENDKEIKGNNGNEEEEKKSQKEKIISNIQGEK